MTKAHATSKAATIFRRSGGTLRMSEALRQGISRYTLYTMLSKGRLERLSRGVYRLTDMEPVGHPDLVTVSQRVTGGVICLVSALAFHGLTAQIPHVVWVAVRRNAWTPDLDWPPVRFVEFSDATYSAGVESHDVDGVTVKLYSPEKTIADCFKYRRKLGQDIAVEALRTYIQRERPDVDALLRFARVCRVERVMRPYLEALL